MAGEVTVSRTSLILAGALVVAVLVIATMATAILAGGGDDKAVPLASVPTPSGSTTAEATPSAALTATPTPTAETPTPEPTATVTPMVTVAPTTRQAEPIPTAVPPTPTATPALPYNAEEKALYNNWRAAQNQSDVRRLTYEQALTDAAWRRRVADIKASVDALVTYFGGPRPFGYVDNTPRTTCESDLISLGLTGQTWAVLVTEALDRQKTSDNPPLGFSSWEKYWENSWDASATLAFQSYSAAAEKVPVSCPSIAS